MLCEWRTTNAITLHTKTVLTVPSRVFTRSGRCLMRYSRTSWQKRTHTHTQQYMPIVTIWLWGAANGWMDGWMDRWLGEYCFKDVKGYLSPNNDENEGVDTPTYVSTTCVSTTATYVCGRTHNACTKLSPLLSNRRGLCYIKPGVTRGCQQQLYTCVRTYMYQLSVRVVYACIFACVFAWFRMR